MSYDIDNIASVVDKGDLIISKTAVTRLRSQTEHELPEIHPLDTSELAESKELPGFFIIRRMMWCGEGSGSTYCLLLEFLSKTLGRADLIICWEGGDSFTGLRVQDGTVTEHEVVKELGREKKIIYEDGVLLGGSLE